jgi:hypothetical protein
VCSGACPRSRPIAGRAPPTRPDGRAGSAKRDPRRRTGGRGDISRVMGETLSPFRPDWNGRPGWQLWVLLDSKPTFVDSLMLSVTSERLLLEHEPVELRSMMALRRGTPRPLVGEKVVQGGMRADPLDVPQARDYSSVPPREGGGIGRRTSLRCFEQGSATAEEGRPGLLASVEGAWPAGWRSRQRRGGGALSASWVARWKHAAAGEGCARTRSRARWSGGRGLLARRSRGHELRSQVRARLAPWKRRVESSTVSE